MLKADKEQEIAPLFFPPVPFASCVESHSDHANGNCLKLANRLTDQLLKTCMSMCVLARVF